MGRIDEGLTQAEELFFRGGVLKTEALRRRYRPAGVTHDDCGRDNFDARPVDRRLCKSKVAMPIGYHRISDVVSPDGGRVMEIVSDCHLVRGGGNPACIDRTG